MKRLTLAVDNTADLEGGVKATTVFGSEGGIVGTSKDADWILKDRQKTVSPKHLRVFYMDDAFCLEPLSNAGVIVNDTARPVPKGEPFQIQDGDTLRIGRFSLRAYITEMVDDLEASSHSEQWADRFTSVETLVDGQMSDTDGAGNVLDSALSKANRSISLAERLEAQRKLDPIELLEEEGGAEFGTRDPLAALDLDEELEARTVTKDLSDYLGSTPEDSVKIDVPDDLQPTTAYFAPPRVQRRRSGHYGEEVMTSAADVDPYIANMVSGQGPRPVEATNIAEARLRDSWLGELELGGEEGEAIDHVLLRPLCQGLGLPVGDMSVPAANALAHDIGEALRVAIEGLMDIHQQEMQSHSLIAETHLHAIEDNPLRLAEDADEAVKDLFVVQSPVHLSASAAISESLRTINSHQAASEAAIDAALDAVLSALAPVALARRFLKYKGHAPRTGDLDAWHWRMYQHYYTELSSNRQGGLSRMFREVFRQVYDREMRARSTEI